MRDFAKRHPLVWAYFYFCYFSLAYQLLIYLTGRGGFSGPRQAILISVLWLIPLLIWPRYSRRIAAVIGIVLWLGAMVGLGYWLIYRQDFSQSVLFIIFESNMAEGSEYLSSYFHWWYLAVFALYGLPALIMWRFITPVQIETKKRLSYGLVYALILGWPFLSPWLLQHKGLTAARNQFLHRFEPAAPWNLVVAWISYREDLAEMQRLMHTNRELPPLKDFQYDPQLLPDTVVLVIGESTNRQRMSLYGYSRPTTPLLDAEKQDLVVFNNVISPRPYTIESLQEVLSFADQKHPKAFFGQHNLLNVMHQAGYDITWITNQQTQTKRNTMLVTLSQMADHQVYLNNNRSQNAAEYDEGVLAPLDEALDRKAPKKMIVVHLLGTHRSYSRRFPPTFDRFNTKEGVPEWVSFYHVNEYNDYDNAVLYNDFVVDSVLKKLKAHSNSAFFLYFSDHGEEVYDTPGLEFAGRNESAPTPSIYTIPFIAWASPDWSGYERFEHWRQFADHAFISADLFYTLPDMLGISFKGLDKTRSLVSDNFMERPRLVGDPAFPKRLQPFENLLVKGGQALANLKTDSEEKKAN